MKSCLYNYVEGIPDTIVKNAPSGWGLGLSENGWMTTKSFYEYVSNIFYPWLIKEGIQFPIFIYADNHSSHFSIPLIAFCRKRNIEVIGLIPNTTLIMQPLDICIFRPFKEAWRKAVPKWKNQNDKFKIEKMYYGAVVKYALSLIPNEQELVITGFTSAGLSPFNPEIVD